MDKSNVFEKIEEALAHNYFSKGHRRIAEYVLKDYDKAAYLTAARLGITTGVSESTVVRFATELGYEGYPEMQRALQEMVRNRLTSVQRIEVASSHWSEDEDILEAVLTEDIDNIRRTLEETSREAFSKAVDSILSARRIYIVGSRSASYLAQFLGYYFNLCFKDCQLVETGSSGETLEQLMRIGSEDVLIAISFPRYSSQTIRALRFAASKQANTIAITDSAVSPLAAYAENLLLARSDMASFVDSLVAPLSLINALIVAIGVKKKDEISKNFAILEGIWANCKVYEQSEEEPGVLGKQETL